MKQNLNELSYQELKKLAKRYGINAQQKKVALIKAIEEKLSEPVVKEIKEKIEDLDTSTPKVINVEVDDLTSELPEVTVTVNGKEIEGTVEETENKPNSIIAMELTYEGTEKKSLEVEQLNGDKHTYTDLEQIQHVIDCHSDVAIVTKGYEEPIIVEVPPVVSEQERNEFVVTEEKFIFLIKAPILDKVLFNVRVSDLVSAYFKVKDDFKSDAEIVTWAMKEVMSRKYC